MIDMTPADVIADPARYLLALLCVVAFVLHVLVDVRQWETFNRRGKLRSYGYAALLVTVGYGAIEAAQQGAPFGLRVLLFIVSLAVIVLSLTIDWRDPHLHKQPGDDPHS